MTYYIMLNHATVMLCNVYIAMGRTTRVILKRHVVHVCNMEHMHQCSPENMPCILHNVTDVFSVTLCSESGGSEDAVERYYYPPNDSRYFHVSRDTVFERELLEEFCDRSLYDHTSFNGFCKAYNKAECRKQESTGTTTMGWRNMNRIRFEECWFRYILCGHLDRLNKLATFKQGKLVCPVIHQCVGV